MRNRLEASSEILRYRHEILVNYYLLHTTYRPRFFPCLLVSFAFLGLPLPKSCEIRCSCMAFAAPVSSTVSLGNGAALLTFCQIAILCGN